MIATRKGFIFTSEAILGLIIATLLIGGIFHYKDSMQTNGIESNMLYFNLDILESMEKAGSIYDYLDSEIDDITFKNYLDLSNSGKYCMNFEIINEDNRQEFIYRNVSCQNPHEDNKIVNYRSIYNDDSIYYVKFETW